MRKQVGRRCYGFLIVAVGVSLCTGAQAAKTESLSNRAISASIGSRGATFTLSAKGLTKPVFTARVGAEVNHHWLWSTAYPARNVQQTEVQGPLGPAHKITVTLSGLPNQPEMAYSLEIYDQHGFGSIQVKLRNRGPSSMPVEDIRVIDITTGSPKVDLGGPEDTERVLSDSYSEDRPPLQIYGLGNAREYPGEDSFGDKLTPIHFAVGSQLVYNQSSRYSLLIAALTAEKWLTVFHLDTSTSPSATARVSSYAVDCTGTTDILKKESLHDDPPQDQIELSLPIPAGGTLSSEKVMFSVSNDYHTQLESYGKTIRNLRHALPPKPAPWGWWSWTAYFFGLNHGTALTNASWLSEHLRPYGFNYFHIDEGYAYANGEYTTPDAIRYPFGLRRVGYRITNLGLHFGIWTAPFRVSERSWVYQHHPDWLVHNAEGKPIQIGFDEGSRDALYVLDTTNPGAQQYLRKTYRILVRQWGIRYIKLDFMDDTAIEGYHYRPHTTAIEALQIGLKIIRDAVGPDVLLDKDGSPMLPAVGYTDLGRLSTDTGHSFGGDRQDATGIAARYYMNGNFYVADPDAFSVSKQLITDRTWHESKKPLSLNEAEVSITLAAVAGGMFEIGDDLPTLGSEPDRMKLATNTDLLNMVRLGRSAVPVDLMTYLPQDEQPSIYFLNEDARQAMLAIFNWTDHPRSHDFQLSKVGYTTTSQLRGTDVFDSGRIVQITGGVLSIQNQAPHSVRLIKIIDTSASAGAPAIKLDVPSQIQIGKSVLFETVLDQKGPPAIRYHWNFGDGTSMNGKKVRHAYTRNGTYTVSLTATGIDEKQALKKVDVTVNGMIRTVNDANMKRRYKGTD